MNNKTRLLPAYAAPKPSVEILQKHTRAIMEVQKRKLNESWQFKWKPDNLETKETSLE